MIENTMMRDLRLLEERLTGAYSEKDIELAFLSSIGVASMEMYYLLSKNRYR